MRSARYGFTSIVVGIAPRNWLARAVVPEPPNGSRQLVIGRPKDALVSSKARETSSGANASLKARQAWKATNGVPALVERCDGRLSPSHSPKDAGRALKWDTCTLASATRRMRHPLLLK